MEILTEAIKKIQNRESKIYFFLPDTGQIPSASINHILNVALELQSKGFQPILLTQEEKYTFPDWLPQYEYNSLPITSLKSKGLKINVEDFMIIPELYVELIKELVKNRFPCQIIIFAQRYYFIFDFLNIGEHWKHSFGIDTVITTSEGAKAYIENTMGGIDNIEIISPFVDNFFTPSKLPQKPIISLFCREGADAEKIYKTFYTKYPHYRWVSFNVLNNLYKEKFAQDLSQCCLAVWVDQHSTFGTFPLEAMACGVPVIGEIPKLIPDWMVDSDDVGNINIKNNGFWVSSKLTIPDQIASFLNSWLTENVPDFIYEEMNKTVQSYRDINFKKQAESSFNNIFQKRISFLNTILNQTNNE